VAAVRWHDAPNPVMEWEAECTKDPKSITNSTGGECAGFK